MLRAAVYIRMSTDDQCGSPERQRAQILPYCQRKGYEVVQVYEDLGMRGSDSTRPEFQRLLQDAQKCQFDIIVVDEQSRLSRNDPVEYMANVALPLREAGVYVEVVDEGRRLTWDREDLAGMLMGFLGQFKAANESATLGRRTLTGMARKAKEANLFVGRAPYGYRYELDGGKRVGLEPDTCDKVEVVRRIFDAYTNRDKSLTAIVAELNSLGISPPMGGARWGKHTVHGILTNHVYAGSYVWGKVHQGKYYRSNGEQILPVAQRASKSERRSSDQWLIIPSQHTAIIDPEFFDRTQQLLVSNRVRTSPSRTKSSYPLSQLLYCSHCGMPMYGTKRRSGGAEDSVYRCGSSISLGTCAPRTVLEKDIIKLVAEVLRERLLDPVERDRLVAEIRRQRELEVDEDEGVVDDLMRNVAKLDAQIAKASKNLGLLDPEFIPDTQAQIRRWRQERASAQAELDRHVRQSPSGSAEHIIDKVEQLVEVMSKGDRDLVRLVVREALVRIDLRFDEVRKKKLTRYPLAGGVVHLKGCVDSSESGPAAAR